MKTNQQFLLVAVGLLTLDFLMHLFTLTYTPIVWSDEVCFNSITVDWLQNGTYYFQADQQWTAGRQALIYGPLFFMLNAVPIALFGNGLFTARLIAFLAGIGVYIWYTATLKKQSHVTNGLALLGIVLFITDPFFPGALHKARMDTLALLLYMGSAGVLLSFFDKPERKLKTAWWLLSAALYGACVITTLRMAVLLPPLLVLMSWLWWKDRFSVALFVRIAGWGFVSAAFLLGWWISAFDSIQECISYMTWTNDKLFTQKPQRWFPHRRNYLLFLISLSACGVGIALLGKRFFTPLHLFLLAYLATYYLFVFDTGPYVMFVLPAYYLLALSTAGMLRAVPFWFRFGRVALGVLLVYNLALFSYRAYGLVKDIPNRKHENIDKFISRNIPADAKVCTDLLYYYSVQKNGNPLQLLVSFQYWNAGVAAYRLDTFDYDYLVISNHTDSVRNNLVVEYLAQTKLEPVAAMGVFKDSTLNKLAERNKHGDGIGPYDGVIYRRIR